MVKSNFQEEKGAILARQAFLWIKSGRSQRFVVVRQALWTSLQNVGGQGSDQSEKGRLELGAHKSWKENETILTGQAKEEPSGNPQSCNGLSFASASSVGAGGGGKPSHKVRAEGCFSSLGHESVPSPLPQPPPPQT